MKPNTEPDLQTLLNLAIQRVECCTEFVRVQAEIIRCDPRELTRVLIDRAKEWQAEVIYVPAASPSPAYLPAQSTSKKSRWAGSWLKKSKSQANLVDILTTEAVKATVPVSSFNLNELLEENGCSLVITNPDGKSLRLKYYRSLTSKAWFYA